MKIKYVMFFTLIVLVVFSGCEHVVKETPLEKTFNHTNWSYNAGIYEVNLRQYTKEGTFKAFEKHLPRLKELGVKILWFMPIHPIGEKNRKGTLGSYYSVKDYKAVNPEFGSLQEFKDLVSKIHEMGMYVIIDWVANHTAWDNVWVNEHPDFYTKDSTGDFTPPDGTDWDDVIDLDYNNQLMREFMLDALKYWVKDCNIDGYRCDVAAMVPTDFWDTAREELDKIKPVFMLAEAHEPELHFKAFDMTYNWQLKDIMNGIADGENDALDLVNLIEVEDDEYPPYAFRMTFTTNHDENTWNGTTQERLGDASETFAVLTNVIEGMPLIYSGQEAGLDKRLKFFDKDEILWKKDPMFNIYKKLLTLKSKNQALWNGEKGGQTEIIKSNNNKNIICFTREKGRNKIFAMFNLSKKQRSVEINNEQMKGSYKELLTDKTVNLNSKEKFDLPAWGYLVYYN
ncbi:MAG: alpha-amylase [Ignavibacteriae bacterium HGW-Ignavibacteriae-2]|jgi:glycosidase|nr:MAG: alpha-amylase [Ignavibacteriae bacterium HGW-Ignavibacteriae-2]